ncbi:unnamed protein product, partial [Trichogramma brassicae]
VYTRSRSPRPRITLAWIFLIARFLRHILYVCIIYVHRADLATLSPRISPHSITPNLAQHLLVIQFFRFTIVPSIDLPRRVTRISLANCRIVKINATSSPRLRMRSGISRGDAARSTPRSGPTVPFPGRPPPPLTRRLSPATATDTTTTITTSNAAAAADTHTRAHTYRQFCTRKLMTLLSRSTGSVNSLLVSPFASPISPYPLASLCASRCEKEFVKTNLLKHKRIFHEVFKDYLCEKCAKRFASKQSLLSHVMGIHEVRKDLACHQYEEKFGQKSHLLLHLKTVHEGRKDFAFKVFDDYLSHNCGKKFVKKSDLLKHQRTVHEGRRSLKATKVTHATSARYNLAINHICLCTKRTNTKLAKLTHGKIKGQGILIDNCPVQRTRHRADDVWSVDEPLTWSRHALSSLLTRQICLLGSSLHRVLIHLGALLSLRSPR